MNYTFKLDIVWFDMIKLGKKTIEGRLNCGDAAKVSEGDHITFEASNGSKLKVKVIRKTVYKTFKKYLVNEGLRRCLPGIYKLKDGDIIYHKYYTYDQEEKFGMVAIEFSDLQILEKETHHQPILVPDSPIPVKKV